MKKKLLKIVLNKSKLTLLLTLAITLIMGSGARFILMDDNIMNMLPKDIDSRKVWDEIVDEFKYSDFLFVAFGKEGNNILTQENITLTWDLTKAFEQIYQVDEVLSLSTINRMDGNEGFLEINDLVPNRKLNTIEIESLTNYINNNSNLKSRMIGKNGDFINIIIRPNKEADFSEMVTSIRKITKPHEGLLDFHFGGQPYIAGKVPDLIKTETQKLMLAGLIIMSIILLINLRSILSVIMIVMLIFMSMLSMMGLLGWIYYFTGSLYFFFTFINSSMPIVLLTIANSDGVHIMTRFFKEGRMHKNVKQALTYTINQLSLPIFLTSITTTAAFLTMVTSPIPAMTGYGVSIGFGIIWAWILSCTFLPASINLIKWNFSTAALTKPSFLEKIVHAFGQNILKYPKLVLTTGIVIILITSLGIRHINVEVNLVNLFKSGHTIPESTQFLDREMAGSMNLIMKVNDDLKEPKVLNQMMEIQNFLETIPTINTTFSIANIIKEMHQEIMNDNPIFNSIPTSRNKVNNLFTMYSMSGNPDDFESLVNYDYNAGIITAMMHTISTKDVVHIASNIENFLEIETPNLNIEVSGLMMFLKDFVSLVVQTSIMSIVMSIFIILFIIWLFFRSWKFGLLSIIPLISAVILNFGLMGWFGIDLSHFTALLTSIIIGVGVDFSIHYISEFIHNMKNNTPKDEISMKVIDNVGYPIILDVFSNMGFGALIFSSLIPLIQMGGLMIFAMFSTSIGTLTILASIMEINKHKLN